MFKQGFTVSGCSLRMLRLGERGTIVHVNHSDEIVSQKLRTIGLTTGKTITLEQRFPRFIVRLGCNLHALNEEIIQAIYVRTSH